MAELHVFNSLTRRKERLSTLEPGTVKIYLCGLTVYDDWHLGHALQALMFDAFRRYLRRLGYRVVFVNNFTDVDDKILRKAAQEGVDFRVISERYIARYLEDLPKLNIERADHLPKATEHIAHMIALIERLVERGHAYAAAGNVLFDVRSFPEYGALSGHDPNAGIAGEDGVLPEGIRRHPADFTLWKAAKPGEPSWESPWGPGRPGWHIECSAMAMHYLGTPFDIHIGGLDLIFPHHENEKAQSEAATGQTFARYWMHNGLLRIRGEKMSKSLGNILGVRRLLEKYSANALRHFVLSSHYRSPGEFDFKLLDDSAKATSRVANLLDRIEAYQARPMPAACSSGAAAAEGAGPISAVDELKAALARAGHRVEEMLADDFNTAGALGAIFELAGEANRHLQDWERCAPEPAVLAVLNDVSRTVVEHLEGLGFSRPAQRATEPGLFEPLVELLIELRADARKRKDFAQSDRIRNRLAELGVELKDTPEGTRFTVTSPRKSEPKGP